jgi:hypothetical protein
MRKDITDSAEYKNYLRVCEQVQTYYKSCTLVPAKLYDHYQDIIYAYQKFLKSKNIPVTVPRHRYIEKDKRTHPYLGFKVYKNRENLVWITRCLRF